MNQALFAQVDQYISDLFEPSDPILDAAEQSLHDAGMPIIQISANQGRFLQILAKICQAGRILELGTLGGYSTIWLARALPENGRLITLELEPAFAEVARKNFVRAGLADKIEVREGKALDLLPVLVQEKAGPFDLIFIDADKPPYAEYFEWAVRLSRPGTLIIADNVIREGGVLDSSHPDERVQGVRRFNELLSRHPGVTATIFQTVGTKEHDGMAIALVK
jgi:caffeoyl-CoA O-methyltransferase